MDTFNFDQDVIERSYVKPVLVDFWAEWCGPCRVLGPVLEALAWEQADRWELVKVNTEEEQELAQTFQIRSIPAVKLFSKGEVVGEFLGALPKHQIESWLEKHLPDERLGDLQKLLDDLDRLPSNENLARLASFLDTHPDLKVGRVALASRMLWSHPDKAEALLEDISPGDEDFEQAKDLRTLIALSVLEDDGSLPVHALLLEARTAIRQGDQELAGRKLIDAVMNDKSYRDELPRRVGIALFRTLGKEHPVTRKLRRLFDMALY